MVWLLMGIGLTLDFMAKKCQEDKRRLRIIKEVILMTSTECFSPGIMTSGNSARTLLPLAQRIHRKAMNSVVLAPVSSLLEYVSQLYGLLWTLNAHVSLACSGTPSL